MRNLTDDEIRTVLLSYPKAKHPAVYNFLGTVGNNQTAYGANINLASDAQAYNWNDDTIHCIRDGIQLADDSPMAGWPFMGTLQQIRTVIKKANETFDFPLGDFD